MPGHKDVGANIFRTFDNYLKNNPSVASDILKAIGDITKLNTGPSELKVKEAVRLIEKELGITRPRRPGKTRLQQDIYEKWVELSGILISMSLNGSRPVPP